MQWGVLCGACSKNFNDTRSEPVFLGLKGYVKGAELNNEVAT
jgi:hypothetical protein